MHRYKKLSHMEMDPNWLLWNEVPSNWSADEYMQALTIVRDSYKTSFLALNNNQTEYNNSVKNLKDTVQRLEEMLAQKQSVIDRYQRGLTQNRLTLKERIFGRFDISKLTK